MKDGVIVLGIKREVGDAHFLTARVIEILSEHIIFRIIVRGIAIVVQAATEAFGHGILEDRCLWIQQLP